MQFTSLAIFGSLFAASVIAAPAPGVVKRSFKVERVANPNFGGHNGPKQLLKSYSKFGMPLPAGLLPYVASTSSSSAAKTEVQSKKKGGQAASNRTAVAATNNSTGNTGVVTATPEAGDVEYLSPVTIGGQTLNMDFDSGSSDLWVFNTGLSTKAQTGHTNFDATKSTTFKAITGAKFSISYGDGSGAAGTVGTDTVNIGGATVTSQAVELATAVSSSFVSDTQSNGLVGLAYSKLNTVQPTQQKTFLDNAISTMPLPLFTADLKANATGSYEFGAIDTSKFTGSLTYANVNTTQGFWQFASTKFSVDGVEMTVADGQAIADTGTTLMLANAAIVNAYYSKVTGAVNDAQVGGVVFPCSSTMPDLAVAVGDNYMATVPGDLIKFATVDAAGTSKFTLSLSQTCL